ncbi:hypothetical protein [Sulfuritalea hydrogenivorans]|uniref:Uncharacterized protein n=1 Tax=Sulfuritalea hydrogenivorans sk43H TaxID=1223802 RepID=W0SBP4_9PROT|nr:hypothetical protein [Sulfuritalea hydrogenivorans]BAO28292.1 hypothetical protein SUTH_00478 [Sulfuritalea hydrogenivorans sk43H]
MESVAQQLEQMIPKSLGDIIVTNRDQVKAYLTTDAEIEALKGAVPIQPVKGELSDWAFITFFLTKKGLPMIYLTGFNAAERSSWMTSLVVAIDGDAVATTSGSVYKLKGDKSEVLDLPYICATLNGWGVGRMLGVPPFFF